MDSGDCNYRLNYVLSLSVLLVSAVFFSACSDTLSPTEEATNELNTDFRAEVENALSGI